MRRRIAKKITNRQVDVLRAVDQLRRIGEPPTHGALCNAIGVTSENTVCQHLKALIEHGLLHYRPLVCGGAELSEKGRKLLEQESP